jgi:hypothetical protein
MRSAATAIKAHPPMTPPTMAPILVWLPEGTVVTVGPTVTIPTAPPRSLDVEDAEEDEEDELDIVLVALDDEDDEEELVEVVDLVVGVSAPEPVKPTLMVGSVES